MLGPQPCATDAAEVVPLLRPAREIVRAIDGVGEDETERGLGQVGCGDQPQFGPVHLRRDRLVATEREQALARGVAVQRVAQRRRLRRVVPGALAGRPPRRTDLVAGPAELVGEPQRHPTVAGLEYPLPHHEQVAVERHEDQRLDGQPAVVDVDAPHRRLAGVQSLGPAQRRARPVRGLDGQGPTPERHQPIVRRPVAPAGPPDRRRHAAVVALPLPAPLVDQQAETAVADQRRHIAGRQRVALTRDRVDEQVRRIRLVFRHRRLLAFPAACFTAADPASARRRSGDSRR